jgi:hypothetical protein
MERWNIGIMEYGKARTVVLFDPVIPSFPYSTIPVFQFL